MSRRKQNGKQSRNEIGMSLPQKMARCANLLVNDQSNTAIGGKLHDFILDSPQRAVEHDLADKCYFLLNEAHWEKLTAVLERPAQVKPTLVRLFASRAPWDE